MCLTGLPAFYNSNLISEVLVNLKDGLPIDKKGMAFIDCGTTIASVLTSASLAEVRPLGLENMAVHGFRVREAFPRAYDDHFIDQDHMHKRRSKVLFPIRSSHRRQITLEEIEIICHKLTISMV